MNADLHSRGSLRWSCFRASLFVLMAFTISFGAYAKNESLRLLISGPITFQFAGYYVAKEKGFYQDAGIQLSILTSNSSQFELIDQVIAHQAEFAIGNSSLAYAALQGKPVVILANIFQRSSGVLITKPDFGNQLFLVRNQRLALPTLMEEPGIYAFLTSQGVAFSDTLRTNPKETTLADFIANKKPVLFGQLHLEPILLRAKNIPFKVIDPVNYGIHFYGDTVFGNQQWVTKNQEQSQRFVEATLKGWKYALENRDEAINILVQKANSTSSPAFLKEQTQVIHDLIMAETIVLGKVDSDRWMLIANFFKQTSLVNAKAQLPSHFLKIGNSTTSSPQYQLVLEMIVALLGFLLLVLIYWFYPRLRHLQRSFKEQEVLFQDAQKKANLDALTGLPNRRLLIERLREAEEHFEKNAQVFALCFLDIDNFKVINDQYGHIVGDEILVQLAKRMQTYLKPQETLSRQGGDEFVLILYDVFSNEDVINKMNALRAIIREPIRVGDQFFEISVSFGYALYQTDSHTIEDLLKTADRRMYREKFKNLELAKLSPN